MSASRTSEQPSPQAIGIRSAPTARIVSIQIGADGAHARSRRIGNPAQIGNLADWLQRLEPSAPACDDGIWIGAP
ncbi:MAG: hypothetical protein ACI9ZH_001798, partial [Paracoccaceae bacterium]